MTKQDLVAQVAKKAGLSMRAAKMAVDTVFGAIADAMKRGDKRKKSANRGGNPNPSYPNSWLYRW